MVSLHLPVCYPSRLPHKNCGRRPQCQFISNYHLSSPGNHKRRLSINFSKTFLIPPIGHLFPSLSTGLFNKAQIESLGESLTLILPLKIHWISSFCWLHLEFRTCQRAHMRVPAVTVQKKNFVKNPNFCPFQNYVPVVNIEFYVTNIELFR